MQEETRRRVREIREEKQRTRECKVVGAAAACCVVSCRPWVLVIGRFVAAAERADHADREESESGSEGTAAQMDQRVQTPTRQSLQVGSLP